MLLLILVLCFTYPLHGLSPHRSMILLNKYGYLDLPNYRDLSSPEFERSLVRDGSYSSAISHFQRFFRLPDTGRMTPTVERLLTAKRCGNPDIATHGDRFSVKIRDSPRVRGVLYRAKRYFIDDERMKWLKTDLTWKIKSYPSKGSLSRPHVRAIFTEAFNLWSGKVNLNYAEEKNFYKDADIIIMFGRRAHGDFIPFDGQGEVLAHAFYPSGSRSPDFSRAGDAHFDDDELWTYHGNPDGKDLLAVAVHELGHSMGLGHSGSENAIMYPFYVAPQGGRVKLDKDDIAGMQKIYGAAPPNKFLPPIPRIPEVIPVFTDPPITTRQPEPSEIDFCDVDVDAIIIIREVELYLFSGLQQWRVDFSKTVTSWISYEVRDGPEDLHYYWPVLPREIKRVDAGLERSDQKIYMFSGSKFWLLKDNRNLSERVPPMGLSLTYLGLPGSLQKVDTVFRWGYNRGVYIIAGQQYWRLDEDVGHFGRVMARYPRPISAVWRGVPVPVEMAYTGLHGKTYFVKNRQYYEFSNLEMAVEGGPKPLKVAWVGCTETSRDP